MNLEDMNRTGVFPEHRGLQFRRQYERVRLTIPVHEALLASGAEIVPTTPDPDNGVPLYTVTLANRCVPDQIVATRIIGTDHLGLRLAHEPAYPDEIETYWEQLDFTPCPRCGSPLMWYEAGYVPGYRVCAGKAHNHYIAR